MKEKVNIIVIDESSFYDLIKEIVSQLTDTNNYKNTDDEWINEKSAMDLLKIKSKVTLAKYRNEGRIEYSQLSSKKILYRKASIQEYLLKNLHGTF